MTLSTDRNEFHPDYAVHPGEILKETLEAKGMKGTDLAQRCGLSEKTVSQIITGKANVTSETAIQLERVLGVSAAVWNNLDGLFRLHAAKAADRSALEGQEAWARKFPIKELAERRLIPKTDDPAELVASLLAFFGVGSVEAWQEAYAGLNVAYRHSPAFKSAPESLTAWLRIGELWAREVVCSRYDKERFLAALREIQSVTNAEPAIFEPKMKALCCDAGVAVVFVAELPGTHLSGATRWLSKDKALLMLSLRHKSDDHFWFSFFHEAGHILLHGKRAAFVDDKEKPKSMEETEADRFAVKMLIPQAKYDELVTTGKYRSEKDISAFARQLGIAPGIVVGRLQHEGHLRHDCLNGLKRKFVLLEHNE
ncbi:MAG: HigA family addiction module antidote protein [Planctomycetes bacterium]|nr:HigA family addiction module antidote protein [Planctomycetota bacterium]